jgi:uncharacterized iron-regulated membrane protein
MKSGWRSSLLWLHLSIGLISGLVIFYLSLTGILLAFKPQILEWSRFDGLPVSGEPVPASEWLPKAGQDPVNLKSLTLWRQKPGIAEIQLGPKRKLISTLTGEKFESSAAWNDIFDSITNLHRWFSLKSEGDHKFQKAFKGTCVILFLLIVISGIVLWWPTAVFKLRKNLKNKAKHWNRHNVFGIWFSPVIVLISLTGLLMAHQWANNLLFAVTGSSVQPPMKIEERPEVPVSADMLGEYIKTAGDKLPQWQTMNVKLAKGAVNISMEEPVFVGLTGRSQLVLDAQSGEVLLWEPYIELSAGRKARSFLKPLHTGEAGGFLGQVLVALGAFAAMLLVWTGFAMSYRRFFMGTK